MHIFKYMQNDDTIYRNGRLVGSYDDFIASNPGFPLTKGEYFEYRDGELDIINEHGHHITQLNLAPYESLITAIYNLGE